MIAAIHQPHYLPWLRYYHKIAAADVFIFLDDVQYEKNGWQNRNKIKGPQGALCLTVPVEEAYLHPICQVRIAANQPRWALKHFRSLEMNYSKAPFAGAFMDAFRDLYGRSWVSLAELNWEILRCTLEMLAIKTPVVRSSEMGVDGKATDRLIQLCREVGADTYLSGAYALDAYLDGESMEQAGIQLAFQEWQCPEYRQGYPASGFVPDLSIVDLLFNAGPESSALLLEGGSVRRGEERTESTARSSRL